MQFIDDFLTTISQKVDTNTLQTIRRELIIHCDKYNIDTKCQEIIPYVDAIPQLVKFFLISKQIEGKSLGTLKLYRLILKDFFNQITKDITMITANDIRIYLYTVQEQRKITNHTLSNRCSIIKSFFTWATKEKYIQSSPADNLNTIKYTYKNREALNDLELEQIRYLITNIRDIAILECLYSTACRVSELININISDIDFENNSINILGKGNKMRQVYLNARAIMALKKYLQDRKDSNDALFVSLRKPYMRLSKDAVEKIFRNISKQAKRHIYPHLIRHTTATLALNRGMDITQLSQLLGHSNIETTMIYAKVNQEKIKTSHHECII